ncbi:DNA-protecting protein DprA [Clostridium psychrophilum]|nr:DNA-protecting protein DprA [Clostridium psychrophilum]MBU3180698.1 DNA-protecting protein DprA [Clostridium psychrophilum]
MRNRLISVWCKKILVVEAGNKNKLIAYSSNTIIRVYRL